MADHIEFFAVAATTLFVVIDPLGVVPVFTALTEGRKRSVVAVKACVISALILAVFVFAGAAALGAVGITMPAFRAAGGALLFLIGLEMVFEKRQARRSRTAEEGQHHDETDENHDDVAVFPLAMPLLAGPGSITSVVLLASDGGFTAKFLTLGAAVAILILSVITLALGGWVLSMAGPTVTMALSRLMGVIVCALSVQYLFDGVRAAFGI